MLAGLKLYEANIPLKERLPELIEAWKMAYPRINIEKEILAAHAWEMSNPTKRKTQKARFLNNWMRQAQEWADRSPEFKRPFTRVAPLPPDPGATQSELDDMHRQTVKALGPMMCKEEHCGVCGK